MLCFLASGGGSGGLIGGCGEVIGGGEDGNTVNMRTDVVVL